MRCTAVFEFEGTPPKIGKPDTWQGGELCAAAFHDALQELEIVVNQRNDLLEALQEMLVKAWEWHPSHTEKARAAIEKAEGCKK